MAKYCVLKTVNNGYRCGCCSRSYKNDPEFFDTEEQALAQFPLAIPHIHVEYSPGYGDSYDIEEVTILDPNGEEIAAGNLVWYGGRGTCYSNHRFYGHIKGIPFDLREGELALAAKAK